MKLENIKNVCVKCGAKCCYLGGPVVTKAERRKILKAGFADVFTPEGKNYYTKSRGGKCAFLKNSLCTVQSVKPLMCKIWPVYPVFKGRQRKFMVLDCPLTSRLSKADIRKLKTLSKGIPKKTAAIDAITGLSPAVMRRLNRFNWERRMKEALE